MNRIKHSFNVPIRIIVLFFYTLLSHSASAQNLVPNSSFENLKTLYPNCWTSGVKADFEAAIEDWTVPNDGTTDILSTLVPPTCITYLPLSSYPTVDWFPKANQLPRTGNNVAGIKPLSETRREYLEVKLSCDLIPGKDYYCEMYVSLSENTNYAQNSLGMYFSDTSVYVNSFSMLNFTPQVVENAIIDDTINWVKISGTFTATGTQRYLIIGSFATAAQVQTSYLGDKGDIDFTYYLIDDVLVRPVDPPELQITGDTMVCSGEKIHLQASGLDNYVWERMSGTFIDSGSTLNYKPSSSMKIKVSGEKCNWKVNRKIEITVFPLPSVKLGKDTLICSGNTVLLDAGNDFVNYLWKDGSVSQTINVSNAGLYSVEVIDTNGCEGKGNKQIDYYKKPHVDLGKDFSTCKTEGILEVNTEQKSDSHLWHNNSTASSFTYSASGVYWVRATNVCGDSDSDSIQINKIELIFPNLITANEDQKNDYFEILGIEEGKGDLKVYNRYGANIYNNEAYSNNWSGIDLSEGVYYYLFDYPTCPLVKGWVEIIK